MLARLIKKYRLFRRLYQLPLRPPKPSIPRTFLLTTPYPFANLSTRDTMENFDVKLKEACQKGESSIAELMNFLKRNVVEISKAYKDSLRKQIEIIDVATKAGPQSTKWDELPEFRTKAADLNRQFNEFVATINILGNLAGSKLLQFVDKQEEYSKVLANHHKELEKIVTTELQEIKALEEKLLAKNKDSIDKAK